MCKLCKLNVEPRSQSAVLLVSIKNVRIWELTAFVHINNHNDKFVHVYNRHVGSITLTYFIFRNQTFSSIPTMCNKPFTTTICNSIDGKTDRTVIFIWNDYVNCRMCLQLLINMEILSHIYTMHILWVVMNLWSATDAACYQQIC